jgi:hypothetical protein
MDIFQRRWEMTRREYVELLNEWLRIDREYINAVSPYEGDPIYEIQKMLDNYMTIEMIGHAFNMAYSDVENVLAAMKEQRGAIREWNVKAEAFEKTHGKPVHSDNTRNFYRVEREYTYQGPGDYILSDKPFDESLYSLYPDFPGPGGYGFGGLR